MNTLYDGAVSGTATLNADRVLGWVQSIREARQTGVIWLSAPSGEKTILHLHRGNFLPPLGAEAALPDFRGEIRAKFIALTAEGAFHSNLLCHFRQRRAGADPVPFGESQFPATFHSGVEPYLLEMSWNGGAGSVLFNGLGDAPHSLYALEGVVREEVGIARSFVARRSDPSCSIAVFEGNLPFDPWREVCLRRSFKLFLDRALERLESLTGRLVTGSFARILAANASLRGLDMSIRERQWVNGEIFSSSQSAAEQYRRVTNELLDHYRGVIGPRLLASTMRAVHDALPGESREVLGAHAILPEEYKL